MQKNDFKPAWWLPHAHLQCFWIPLARGFLSLPPHHTERLELPDGDFVDLVWIGEGQGPLVILLHGLAGSFRSPYVLGMSHVILQHGWRAVVLQFRNCSDEPNRLPRTYHFGDTDDLHYLVQCLRQREPDTQLLAVGYSLGGNVLLKWLGEQGHHAPLAGAVAVSVPMLLAPVAKHMEHSLWGFYQWHLLRLLKQSLRRKCDNGSLPLAWSGVEKARTFWELDEYVTAPLHGFVGADDYYQRCSSRPFLAKIHVPTLIIHAYDDPFMTPAIIPSQAELSSAITLHVTSHGGHVGYVSGYLPWQPVYWLEQRILDYLSNILGVIDFQINNFTDNTPSRGVIR